MVIFNDKNSNNVDNIIDAIGKFILKNFSSMRSDLMHPYIGVKFADYLDTVEYIRNNLSEAIVCNSRKELFSRSLELVRNDGLFLEFGVKTGKTINQIAERVKNIFSNEITIYGFDSFEGLPENWSGNRTMKSKLSVKGKLPKVTNNVKIISGWFCDTVPKFYEAHQQDYVAFLHIDCDLYISTKDIFDGLGNLIKEGTIIIFDEYFNYPFWRKHEYKAFQEFIAKRNLNYEYLFYGHTQTVVRIYK